MRADCGAVRPLASVCWDWGQQYEQLIRSIRSGGWESDDPANESAVSYWWGMSSGVVDVRLADTVPAGVRKLAEILQRDIRMSILNPFDQVDMQIDDLAENPLDPFLLPAVLLLLVLGGLERFLNYRMQMIPFAKASAA